VEQSKNPELGREQRTIDLTLTNSLSCSNTQEALLTGPYHVSASIIPGGLSFPAPAASPATDAVGVDDVGVR
jgi:hypothetical protein